MRCVLLAGVLALGACGEESLVGELVFEPEPELAEFEDSIVAITLFELTPSERDNDGEAVELFTIRDAESSPVAIDVEPSVVRNDKDYFITVHADMNGNQRVDTGDYANNAQNDVFDGKGPFTVVLDRL